jgi:hypothetical protein
VASEQILRVEFDRVVESGYRGLGIALLHERKSQFDMCLNELRLETYCRAKRLNCFVSIVVLGYDLPHRMPGLTGSLYRFRSLLMIAPLSEGESQVVVGIGVAGHSPCGCAQRFDGTLRVSEKPASGAEVVVRLREIRPEYNRAFQFHDRISEEALRT